MRLNRIKKRSFANITQNIQCSFSPYRSIAGVFLAFSDAEEFGLRVARAQLRKI